VPHHFHALVGMQIGRPGIQHRGLGVQATVHHDVVPTLVPVGQSVLGREDHEKLQKALEQLVESRIFIDDSAGVTLAEMRARVEREQGPRNPLKAGYGGYYDIDFALMYLRLKGAGIFYRVLNTPERIRVIEVPLEGDPTTIGIVADKVFEVANLAVANLDATFDSAKVFRSRLVCELRDRN